MRNPNDLDGEVSKAWSSFTNAGFGHALQVRLDDIVATVWPFDARRNFLSLPHRVLTGGEAWFTVHDRTLGGMVLFVLLPGVFLGFRAWHRRRSSEWVWMFAAPLALAVLFWGIAPQGLGAALLQPTGAVLIVVAAGGLATAPRIPAFAVAGLAAVEAGSVVWWGLFAERAGAAPVAIVISALLWGLPWVALVVLLVRRDSAREAAHPGRAVARKIELELDAWEIDSKR
jgi:hypothetical protein